MGIEEIGALIGIVTAGVTLFVWLLGRLGRRLSPEEKEILKACAQDGEIRILHTDMYGDWIRAGKTDFFNQKDPAHAAKYVEAFNRIMRRGLARHEGGFLYKLTGTGFNQARRLH